jgi:hypothetical protein
MIITTPERVQSYLSDKGGDRLPFSCTLATLQADTDLSELLTFAVKSLKAGAGVKIVITDTFQLGTPRPDFKLFLDIKDNSDSAFFDEVRYPERLNAHYHPDTLLVKVEDSIESILEGVTKVLANSELNQEVAVDLSQLRPRDTVNSKGLVASGAVIFAQLFDALEFHIQRQTVHSLLKLFGTVNSVILRGGYKKGIITSACSDQSPLLTDYLNVPLVSLPGSHKKGLVLTRKPDPELEAVILDKVNTESMFLQKHQPGKGYANVCQGIFLKDRGTCLIYRINLGKVTDVSTLAALFAEATRKAIYTHWEWRQLHPERAKMWASLEQDNQIAVDVMGLANLLANLGISYDTFISALWGETKLDLVRELKWAYSQSVLAADQYCEELGLPLFGKLHTVEPAQSHSYRETDISGYTVARGIFAPFSRFVNRMSQAANETVKTYDYGSCETRLTPQQHLELCQGWYNLMANYGRPHAISYDTYADFTHDSFDQWYYSSLPTLYYNLSKDYNTQDYGRKVIQPVKLCSSCED